MIIKQVSAFLENKQGRLCAAVDVLAKNGIDISALSLADTSEYGILRMIVDAPERARDLLHESGVTVRVSHVIAVAMNDRPGGAVDILHVLAGAGISIEYMYACVGRVSGKALMVLRVDDRDRAEQLLRQSGFGDVRPDDIYRVPTDA